MTRTEKPTIAGRLIAVLVGLLLLLAVAEVGLRLLMPEWPEFYSARFMRTIDVEGHGHVATGQPGFDGWFAQNNGDFRARIRINDFGLRNPEPVEAANGAIWVVGDSMTFGWGVEQDEMYSSRIASVLGAKTYNVASPGTDVCGYRALIARMPGGVQPAAVVVGLVLENDLLQYNCSVQATAVALPSPTRLIDVKVWLTGRSALYNVLAVTLKRVDIVRRTLIAIGLVNQEQAYKRFFAPEEVEAVTASTADELANLRKQLPAGTPFAVLIVPARFEIAYDDQPYHQARVALGRALLARGIGVIDPVKAFEAAGFAPTHFIHDGHWSPLGHRLAGEAAAEWLRANLRR